MLVRTQTTHQAGTTLRCSCLQQDDEYGATRLACCNATSRKSPSKSIGKQGNRTAEAKRLLHRDHDSMLMAYIPRVYPSTFDTFTLSTPAHHELLAATSRMSPLPTSPSVKSTQSTITTNTPTPASTSSLTSTTNDPHQSSESTSASTKDHNATLPSSAGIAISSTLGALTFVGLLLFT